MEAPMSRPPADRPSIAIEDATCSLRNLPQSMKSSNVLHLARYFPSVWYHFLPSSDPPLMWAIT